MASGCGIAAPDIPPGDKSFPNQRVPGGNPGCPDPSPEGRSPTGIITSCRPLCSPPRLPKTRDNWEWEQKVRTVLLSDVRMSKRRWHRAGGNKGPSGSMRLAGTRGCFPGKAMPEPAEQQCHRLEPSSKMLRLGRIPKRTRTRVSFVFPQPKPLPEHGDSMAKGLRGTGIRIYATFPFFFAPKVWRTHKFCIEVVQLWSTAWENSPHEE